jgi:hypothetical protein
VTYRRVLDWMILYKSHVILTVDWFTRTVSTVPDSYSSSSKAYFEIPVPTSTLLTRQWRHLSAVRGAKRCYVWVQTCCLSEPPWASVASQCIWPHRSPPVHTFTSRQKRHNQRTNQVCLFSFVIYTKGSNSWDISNRTICNARLAVTMPTRVMVASSDVPLTFDLYS